MFLVDSHCHLDILDYHSLHMNIEDVAAKARVYDVKLMLAVCTTISSFHTIQSITGQRNDILFSCGIHPLHLDKLSKLSEIVPLAKDTKVVAIGETGLDYHYSCHNKIKQKIGFRKHIRIARLLNKPIIVHMRNASKDILNILHEENAIDCRGVVHCFTENKIVARKLLDIGFFISFSGIITFRNAWALREIVRYAPLDRILVETDSPYLAPVPYRGKENQPAYVYHIAKFIAEIRGISLSQIAKATTDNFIHLFQLNNTINLPYIFGTRE